VRLINVIIILLIVVVILAVMLITGYPKSSSVKVKQQLPETTNPASPAESMNYWVAPDTTLMAAEKNAEQIRYGRDLVAHTALYFGPKGKIAASTNGMNCQNCHLDAGTRLYGNNYGAVASTYPKFRARSGTIETISKRVNDCFQRSLNGSAIDTMSKEMLAIVAYIKWLGKDVGRGKKPEGAGLKELAYVNRAADPERGKELYHLKCKTCHGVDGSGKADSVGLSYLYPPLWGEHSYNIGAGLYRLSRFAAYIKYNMPQGATYNAPQLSDEEAWDIAAFVNSQPRPQRDLSADWPDIRSKPVDHPFGPYADNFSEQQHKYGPFEPIAKTKK
jgi:thiosulfate dehydrogenase